MPGHSSSSRVAVRVIRSRWRAPGPRPGRRPRQPAPSGRSPAHTRSWQRPRPGRRPWRPGHPAGPSSRAIPPGRPAGASRRAVRARVITAAQARSRQCGRASFWPGEPGHRVAELRAHRRRSRWARPGLAQRRSDFRALAAVEVGAAEQHKQPGAIVTGGRPPRPGRHRTCWPARHRSCGAPGQPSPQPAIPALADGQERSTQTVLVCR
jgi:hypothetical protein